MKDSSQRSFICYPNQRLVVVSLYLLNVQLDCTWWFPSFEFFWSFQKCSAGGLFNSTLQSLCLVVHYVLRQCGSGERPWHRAKMSLYSLEHINCSHHLHILYQAENYRFVFLYPSKLFIAIFSLTKRMGNSKYLSFSILLPIVGTSSWTLALLMSPYSWYINLIVVSIVPFCYLFSCTGW